MKRSDFWWQAGGFAAVTFLGTILHFLFDWTGESAIVAPFSAVNESTWEHMKLLFWPLFFLTLVQFPFHVHPNFWGFKLSGALTGLLLIPILFYTYNGAIGKSPDWLNIAIFYISAAAALSVEYWAFQKRPSTNPHPTIPVAIFILLAILFVLFTFYPPRLPIFQDPITKTYGLQ